MWWNGVIKELLSHSGHLSPGYLKYLDFQFHLTILFALLLSQLSYHHDTIPFDWTRLYKI